MDTFDWIFIVTGFIFFVLMIIAFILMSKEKFRVLQKVGGIGFSVLLIPLTIILIDYIIVGKGFRLIIFTSLIIVYLITELLLDLVFKIEFRSKPALHIPYIILEYAACFSYVFGTLDLDRTIGWIMSGFFWTMLIVLIYYLIKQGINKRKTQSNENQRQP